MGENTEKYATFTVPIENQVTRIDKKGEKKFKKYNSLIDKDLWQAHCEILSIFFLREFIGLNVT